MRLLISGGAGFIGSAVIRHVIQHTPHTVVNVDKLTYAGNLESLSPVSGDQRYALEHADIADRARMDRILAAHQPDVIMHLAAESHVDRSIDNPGDFIETNIVGTYSLLEAARAYWQALAHARRVTFRFHHVSTDEVYGDLGRGTSALFTEDTPYAPSSPYAASKAASDHLVRAWQRTFGLPTLITNCSNNYGPYQFAEKLIPHTILSALFGKRLAVYGDGQHVRDWLYVEDHARALLSVLSDGQVGQTYNIGGHTEQKNLTVVQTICDLLEELAPGRRSPELTHYRDLITFVPDRPGHDERYATDASKIERALGWRPRESFASGLRKTVLWYLDNEAWWQRILSGAYRLTRIGQLSSGPETSRV